MTANRTQLMGRAFLFALLVCLPTTGLAFSPQLVPQDMSVRVWNKRDGLPEDSVTSVIQSRDGYLWIGTSAGLVRFDGLRFVPITPQSGKTNTPICVSALCEDSKGQLWIGTQGDGLLRYAGGSLNSFHVKDGALDQTIHSIAEDAAGNLWLATPTGLSRVTDTNVTRFTAQDGLPNDFVSNVHIARSGTVWITTKGGTCQFKDGRIYPFPFQTDSPGRNPESLGVYEDRRGNLWAFGDTYLVNLTEGQHLNHFRSGNASSPMRIWSLCEGRSGELWIGTSGRGLYRFAGEKFTPLELRSGSLTSDVRALCEDREGNLWLGTDGGGLVRLQQRSIRVLDASAGLPNRPAVCLGFAPQGRSWIGFERGGLYADAGKSFVRISGESGDELQNLISSICLGRDSALWVGTLGAGLFRVTDQMTTHYTTANGLSDNSVLSVALDSKGATWVGTLSGGLHRITGTSLKSFGAGAGLPNAGVVAILPARNGGLWLAFNDGTVFRGENDTFRAVVESQATAGKSVCALYEDAAGRLWLGTAAGRLVCATGDHFLTWDLNLGAQAQPLLGILGDDDGDLWLGTGGAIYRIAQKDIGIALPGQTPPRPQLIFKSDSMVGTPPRYGWPRAARSQDDKLWFAMADRVIALQMNGAISDPPPPPVLIEEISVNDQPLAFIPTNASALPTNDTGNPTRLPSDLRSLEIQFTALNFSSPEKIRFRHRLDGSDANWVMDSDTSRRVHYGRLPYGTYTFRVQAGLADETWFEQGAAFTFLRPTPMWRNNWALLLYGLAGVMVVTGIARMVSHRRLQRRLAAVAAQRAMEQERMRIAQDMHDEIGSKLTKISYMSERAKNELQGQEHVARKLDSIAYTSRDLLQSLDEIVWAVNPHNDTLEHLAAYLGHYVTEYLQNTTVECELHIPRGLPHHPLSAETRHNLFLAFEESLNNALKHGRPSRIKIHMAVKHSHFEVMIEDNGCGFDFDASLLADEAVGTTSGKRQGNGLRNMSRRLAKAGGECRIHSRRGQGTTISLSISLNEAPRPDQNET